MTQQPYVSRPEAEEFLDALGKALKSPAESPVVFHVWGIGGVGKSTLTRKVKEIHGDTVTVAEVSFGLTEGIEEPIPLMARLYEQIVIKDPWSRDPFWEKYDLYFETIHQVHATTPPPTYKSVRRRALPALPVSANYCGTRHL
jgi:hypothetical protein